MSNIIALRYKLDHNISEEMKGVSKVVHTHSYTYVLCSWYAFANYELVNRELIQKELINLPLHNACVGQDIDALGLQGLSIDLIAFIEGNTVSI